MVEFLFMLPVMLALSALMLRVSTAIQVSIVNQQYSRAQALFLAMNSSQYPRLGLRESALTNAGYNQYFIGVSENVAPKDGGAYTPQATVVRVGDRRGGSNAPQEQPAARSLVRIRNTVTLCTQANVLPNGTPILPMGGSSQSDIGVVATSRYNIPEDVRFGYCRSPLGYTP